MKSLLPFITLIFLAPNSFFGGRDIYAQDTTTINFFNQIKTYDISTVLKSDSLLAEHIEEGLPEGLLEN